MGRLTGISGKAAVQAFVELGYQGDYQTGSHVILYHPTRAPLSVPQHTELASGLLRGLIRRAGLEVDAFLAALK